MIVRAVLAAAVFGIFATPLGAEAHQAGKVYRIGVLCGTICGGRPIEAFRQGLRERGWLEGRTITIEYRAAGGRYERLPQLATELVQLNADVLVATGATTAVPAAKASTSVPVVFFGVAEPVKLGIVRSLAHPGGNVTGLTYTSSNEYWAKLLELLKAPVPPLQRVGVISDLQDDRPFWWPHMEHAGRALTVQINPPLRVRGPETFQEPIAQLTQMRVGGVIVTMASTTYVHREALADQLLRVRLPSIGPARELPEAGGLLSYGTDFHAAFVRLADYVDRILRGTKPGDLPVEQPRTFELVINKTTAKALGLTIPPALLLRADHVIE